MHTQPTDLSLEDAHTLLVEWSDGQCRRYRVFDLRRHCPCASCNAERMKGESEAKNAARSEVTIQGMSPVGNYAYQIEFSDGHATGLFTLEQLLELGTLV